MITTIDDARYELEVSIEEACGDNPDVNPDDVASDMLLSVAFNCTPDVARELCRRELGYVPSGLESLLGRKDWVK